MPFGTVQPVGGPFLEADLGTFTSTGAGTAIDTHTGFAIWTWQVITDASSTPAMVKLQGSIDGTNYFDLDEWSGTGSTMRHVAFKPVRYIRAYVEDMGDATQISVKVYAVR